MRPITSIVVHCSATEVGTVESIREYHIKHNGWKDIGYHYVIYKDGSTHMGRAIDRVGAHCPEVNRDSIGICLIGLNDFKDIQFTALQNLIDALRIKYPDIKKLYEHREFPSAKAQGKNCPNTDVKGRIKWKQS